MMPILLLWQGSTNAPAPVALQDGAGIRVARRRRHAPARFDQRTPEDIRREQLEDERYLAELEKPQPVPASERRETEPETNPATTPAAAPILADVIARAASAQQVIARARASSAEALAKVKADERRRTALLLLALD